MNLIAIRGDRIQPHTRKQALQKQNQQKKTHKLVTNSINLPTKKKLYKTEIKKKKNNSDIHQVVSAHASLSS